MTSSSEFPELERPPTYATVDPSHPTIDVNHEPSPDVKSSTLSPTPGHDYEFVLSEAGLQVKHGENVLYYVGRYEAIGFNDIVLYAGYDAHGPQLARADFIQDSKDFKFYVGGLKKPSEDEWDVARRSSDGKFLSPSYFRFEAPAVDASGRKKYFWQKTHGSKLGASKLSTRDYKLVDEMTDDIIAVYTDNWKIGSVRGSIHFYRKPNNGFEIACLVVLLSILEKSRRYMQVVNLAAGNNNVR